MIWISDGLYHTSQVLFSSLETKQNPTIPFLLMPHGNRHFPFSFLSKYIMLGFKSKVFI